MEINSVLLIIQDMMVSHVTEVGSGLVGVGAGSTITYYIVKGRLIDKMEQLVARAAAASAERDADIERRIQSNFDRIHQRFETAVADGRRSRGDIHARVTKVADRISRIEGKLEL
jgi:hypothetical protein